MPAAYGEDLAYIHHEGFGTFARDEAPRLVTLLEGHHRVTELGCGSGIVAQVLTRAGHAVTGINQSPAMVRLAKRNAPKAKFRTGSFHRAAIPTADAVVAVGEVFNYGRHALLPVFRRVFRALPEGGVFTFDFAGPGRGGAQATAKFFAQGRDWAVLVKRVERGNHLTRRMTNFRKVGALYRRSEEEHEQTLYAPSAMLALLRKAGFTAALRSAHAPGHYVVVARK